MIMRFIMLPILLIIFFSLLPAMVFSEEEKEEKKEPRDLDSTSYLELGFNFGTPVAFNAALGYWFGPIGLRVSGMYWVPLNGISGIQGNLGIRLADNIHRRHALALVVGTIHLDVQDAAELSETGVYTYGDMWDLTYFGFAYNLNVGGFFLEVGTTVVLALSVPEEAPIFAVFIPPVGIWQIGYMYRFIPPE